jgi:hypothetical protein
MRDCYEAVVIASFFYLLLSYIGETEQDQAEAFKAVKFKKWIWPLGSLRYKPSGPYFLVIMKWSIGQCVPANAISCDRTDSCNPFADTGSSDQGALWRQS